jgi:hypothetical protein
VSLWRTDTRFVAQNATIDEDVGRTYIPRICNPLLIYFRLCSFLFCTFIQTLHIYLIHYAQCVVYFFYSILNHCFHTLQDGGLVPNAGGVRQGPLGSVH